MRPLVHLSLGAFVLGGGETATGRFRGLTAEGFLRLGTNGSERIITSGDIFETG